MAGTCPPPPTPRSLSNPHPNPIDQRSLAKPTGSLDTENLGKRKIEADSLCIAFLTEIHEPFIRTVQTNKGNFFSICREKTWKTLLQEQQYLPAEILENRDVPIFGGFESQESGLSRYNRNGWQVHVSTRMDFP